MKHKHVNMYERVFEEQQGVCTICGNPPAGRRLLMRPNRTGKIGLVCARCNVGLGYLAWFRVGDRFGRASLYLQGGDTPVPASTEAKRPNVQLHREETVRRFDILKAKHPESCLWDIATELARSEGVSPQTVWNHYRIVTKL
jgi:hypothetical protein